MRIAFYGSSLLSSYWNGAATYYRGLLRDLVRNGRGELAGQRQTRGMRLLRAVVRMTAPIISEDDHDQRQLHEEDDSDQGGII